MSSDRIEILSVDILNNHRPLVQEFWQISKSLKIGLGWHYLLDLIWSAEMLSPVQGKRILDAGAGFGMIQFWLASKGADVVSVDRESRANIGRQSREWCTIKGLRSSDLSRLKGPSILDFLPPKNPKDWGKYPDKLRNTMARRLPVKSAPEGHGTLWIYNQDLSDMADIPESSIDAIVSISALEHNTIDGLRNVVKELLRVLKPGGKLVATLSAAEDKDWFHEPSKGWCYTEKTLRDIFGLPDCPSNYDKYDELFDALKKNNELKENLADFYFKSDDNGMPWGKWDPKYQPVGVVKEKHKVTLLEAL